MAVAAIFTSCDEHRDFLDTGMKIGHVLCTDGNVMSFQQYEVSDKEAIAVVFHTNTDTEDRILISRKRTYNRPR